MNAQLMQTIIKLVRQLTTDIQTLPRELLDQMGREMASERQKFAESGTLTEPIAVFLDDELVRVKLLMQWCNQAKEQLLTDAEVKAASEKCGPDLVIAIMRGGPR